MAADHHHHPCICRSSTVAAVTLAPCFCHSVDPAYHHPHPPPGLRSTPPCFTDPQHQQPHFFDPCSNSLHTSQTLLHHRRVTQCCCPPQHFLQEFNHLPETQPAHPQPGVSSLLHRIASLESSLRRRSVYSHSLYNTAARTIQSHFRAFLVRRSRTLRQLKELAAIKSALNNLKSSSSGCDPQSVSHKANRLLLRLDSIQGSDPMIREGKKSISRELLKLLDETCTENYSRPSRVVKIVNSGSGSSSSYNESRVQILHEMEKMESIMNKYIELRKSVEEEDDDFENHRDSVTKKSGILHPRNGCLGKRHGEVQSKVNKVVTFAEDGNARTIKPISSREPYRSVSSNEECVENLCRRVEDLGMALKEVEVYDEASGSSDGET